ncbi:hypothetical protein DFJ73DRAFT_758911 [Zopfochytrium polystomum]|nr:hypothetical protein DFJ73DRAFT_758911 [Zopfochytrium polystomum]
MTEHQQQDVATLDVSALGVEFQRLKAVKGHFSGGDEFVKDVDGFNGKKHLVMQSLGKILGAPGTPVSEIFAVMGQPDRILLSSADGDQADHVPIPLMPGPVVPSGTGSQEASPSMTKLIYSWRGGHDYLWFKVDSVKEVVAQSGWYNALE